MRRQFKIILSTLFACAVATAAAQPGLTVQDGVFLNDGKAYRGIGVNYFNLFYRTLQNRGDTSYEDGLKQLGDAGIPFARFMCGGFWPRDWELYLSNKDAYFKQLDAVIQCAESHNIGLIPSLFWYAPTVSDIVGEPLDQLGNPDSKTIGFIRQYTSEVVQRYKDSPVIWGWEFGNEYNLETDLPNASEHRPRIVPHLKTALKRTERDELKSAHMMIAFQEFARTIRKYDTARFISSGNTAPRNSAYHNRTEKSWTADTPEQFTQVMLLDNPNPFDTLGVHIYPRKKLFPGRYSTVLEFCEALQTISAKVDKPVFIGEFGVPATFAPKEENQAFLEILTAIEKSRIPLSALWVYDHDHQDKDWNVTFANDRAYMLKRIAEAHRRLNAAPSQ